MILVFISIAEITRKKHVVEVIYLMAMRKQRKREGLETRSYPPMTYFLHVDQILTL